MSVIDQIVKRRLLVSQPCTCCGSRLYWHFPVIWDALAQEWELTPTLRRFMDEREGTRCVYGHASWRIRHLASALLSDIAATRGQRYKTVSQMVRASGVRDLQIAEVNQLPGLHKFTGAAAFILRIWHG